MGVGARDADAVTSYSLMGFFFLQFLRSLQKIHKPTWQSIEFVKEKPSFSLTRYPLLVFLVLERNISWLYLGYLAGHLKMFERNQDKRLYCLLNAAPP